eukprot:sb/3476763/
MLFDFIHSLLTSLSSPTQLAIPPNISPAPLSWLFPLIGHTGICTADGVIQDFSGPYMVTVDNMAFGNPTKYWQLDPAKITEMEWDTAVLRASQEYRGRMVSNWGGRTSQISEWG